MISQKLSIYLVKNSNMNHNDVINIEMVHQHMAVENIDGVELDLYSIKGNPHLPEWAKFFANNISDLPADFFEDISSSGAILIVLRKNNMFLMTFGTGHLLVNNNAISKNFGLKVTLNSVEKNKIKSLDKGNYNELSLLTRNQSSKDSNIYALKVDSELDIISNISGVCTEKILGDKITGKDALYVQPNASLHDLPSILDKALEKYKEDLPYEFEWIDNISPSKKEDADVLDELLEEMLRNEDIENIWMVDPEIIDQENIFAYSFENRQKSLMFQSLAPVHLIDYFKEKKATDYLSFMKNKKIHVLDNNYCCCKNWIIYNCIYTEIEDHGQTHILRNGKWYSVKEDFILSIDKELESLKDCASEFQFPIYSFHKEEEYIKHVCAQEEKLTVMDQKLILHGGGNNKVEFCDIIKDKNKFIHVKYYKGSQSMSHLFAQGAVSGEFFVGDKEFREKLNKKLPECLQLENWQERPAGDYEIIFAIATKKSVPRELPIFSKINLKNFYRRLTALNYKVKLCKIEIDDTIYKEKNLRPNK